MHKKVQVLSILRKEDKGGGMMERLTYRTTKGEAIGNSSVADIGDILEKLAEYEDLEEQGLLLRLPCKVGDIVYSIAYNGKIYPVKATRDARIVDGVLHIICESWRYSDLVSCDDIGKTVFLTQAEAEQKVKELIEEKKIKMYDLD